MMRKHWRDDMKKRCIAAVLAAVMVMGTMLTGCGSSSNENASSSETTDTAEAENNETADKAAETESTSGQKKQVVLWHSMVSPEVEPFQEMIDNFNANSQSVEVVTEWVARDEQTKQLTIGNMAGELPDMVFVDNPEVINYGEMGVFQDIKALFDGWEENQFLESITNSCVYDGKMYGVPYIGNNLALFYDKDMLEAAGVEAPTTWDELTKAAEAATKDGVYGFAFSAIKNAECTFQFIPFLWSAEGDWTEMDSANSVEAMTYYSDFVKNGLANKEVLNWSQADVCKQFASGNCAMMINGSWNVGTLRNDAPDKNWGVVPIPVDKVSASCLGGEALCITKTADAEASFEFIEYLCGKEISAPYAKSTAKFSPRSDVDNDVEFADDPEMKVFADEMKNTKPRGPYPKWTEVDNAIIEACQSALTDAKTPEQACKDAAAKIADIQASLE